MRRGSKGQAGAEFAMVVAFLFALGVMAVQFFGLGLTAFKVSHAAQQGAYVAASSIEAASDRTPCWAVTGGLTHPDAFSDAAICRAVMDNLGDVDPKDVDVTVSPALVDRTKRTPIHVTVTYRAPIGSPLLRLFAGDSFTTTSDASSWSN